MRFALAVVSLTALAAQARPPASLRDLKDDVEVLVGTVTWSTRSESKEDARRETSVVSISGRFVRFKGRRTERCGVAPKDAGPGATSYLGLEGTITSERTTELTYELSASTEQEREDLRKREKKTSSTWSIPVRTPLPESVVDPIKHTSRAGCLFLDPERKRLVFGQAWFTLEEDQAIDAAERKRAWNFLGEELPPPAVQRGTHRGGAGSDFHATYTPGAAITGSKVLSEKVATEDDPDVALTEVRWSFSPPSDAEVEVLGPHCLCGSAEGTVKATAKDTSVTFRPFEVVSDGPGPTVKENTGGPAARVVLTGDGELTGKVRLVPVYVKGGKTERGEPHEVSFCKVKKPLVGVVPIGRGNQKDFVYSDGSPGTIVLGLEGRAYVDGQNASEDLLWEIEPNPDPKLVATIPRGAKQTFKGLGLPDGNTGFGLRRVSTGLTRGACSCRSEAPAEVRLFFPRDAKNNPGGELPNWAYYWRQTKAGQGIPFQVGQNTCGRNLGAAGGAYSYCADVIFLPPNKPALDCKHPPDKSTRNEGIDCFAQTLKHEGHHRTELKAWWEGRPVDPGSDFDPDGDLMPLKIEVRYGCKEGVLVGGFTTDPVKNVKIAGEIVTPGALPLSGTQFSCPLGTGMGKRPFPDVVDSEVNAYWVGWQWATGSANEEDWARPGKNWP